MILCGLNIWVEGVVKGDIKSVLILVVLIVVKIRCD